MAQDDWTIGEITFSGLVDGYYQWNSEHPYNGVTTGRNFEVRSDSFALNMVELSAYHDADPIGFRLDLGFGKAWDIFNSFDLTLDPRTTPNRYIQQAYVTIAPEGWGGFTFDFGKFFTAAGAELTENNYTWTYGRGWLYANGPYYHFGARINKEFGEHLILGFQLVNGWNNVEDNNSGKTMIFTSTIKGEKATWANNFFTGPEGARGVDGWRNFFDTVLTLTPNDTFNMYATFDYGWDNAPSHKPTWWAIAFAPHLQLNEKNALTFRYEYYDDEENFAGYSTILQSYTATYEYKWAQGLAMRLEWRMDTADDPVFNSHGGFSDKQNTLTLGFIGYFGGK